MTGTKVVVVAEVNTTWAQQNARKELKIKQKYETKLAALNKKSSFPLLNQFRLILPKYFLPIFSDLQVHKTNINTIIYISSSNLKGSEDEPGQLSQNIISTNSTF